MGAGRALPQVGLEASSGDPAENVKAQETHRPYQGTEPSGHGVPPGRGGPTQMPLRIVRQLLQRGTISMGLLGQGLFQEIHESLRCLLRG